MLRLRFFQKYFFPSKRQIEDVANIENYSSSTTESEYLESSTTTSASISDDVWEDLELDELDDTEILTSERHY